MTAQLDGAGISSPPTPFDTMSATTQNSPGADAIIPGVIVTEAQADKILKELRTIKICVMILAVIIALASAKSTFNL